MINKSMLIKFLIYQSFGEVFLLMKFLKDNMENTYIHNIIIIVTIIILLR